MYVLDENITEGQRRILQSERLRVRQIGNEVGRSGMQDEEILPLLHQLQQPTFFTRDQDFYERRLCHPNYCLVFLDVTALDAAEFIRKFLRHSDFKQRSRRMGTVARVSPTGIRFWRLHDQEPAFVKWAGS